jgi:hypothetical protein
MLDESVIARLRESKRRYEAACDSERAEDERKSAEADAKLQRANAEGQKWAKYTASYEDLEQLARWDEQSERMRCHDFAKKGFFSGSTVSEDEIDAWLKGALEVWKEAKDKI